MEYVLEMKDISKTFPGVVALDHVQLQVRPGEVHALMGENGAGKSTLMKILMGIYTKNPDGEILFDGKPYHASNPKEAMDMGVAMIHQEVFPAGLRAVSGWMPLGVGIDLLKSVSMGCYDRMAVPVMTLLAIAVICGTIAVRTFRWE